MTPLIFCDIDGTLVDYIGGICQAWGINNPYLEDSPQYQEVVGIYDLCQTLSMPQRQLDSIGSCHNFWKRLRWLKDGRQLLQLVERIVGKENVRLLSQPTNEAFSYAGKMLWIKRHLPDYVGRSLLGVCKTDAGGPGKILIDDCEENIEAWKKLGGIGILVPRPWNRLGEAGYVPHQWVEARLRDELQLAGVAPLPLC